MRRRQIAQGVGDPCDPDVEAWLGCKGTDNAPSDLFWIEFYYTSKFALSTVHCEQKNNNTREQ
ncbi:hypothetical protein JG687_00018661 [Phytophthora cactorum]|uniref:WLGC domain-containing protein n=1 Tax=Phytophthora cactorum TaxID=29920 RepID=A0A8T1TQ24_9STRA|nr:hypothetical protein GQ600_26006 [Phytophthora cactorum]KAG6943100.1 hypothetical protein JG687_00018661 [Phytophthora cactorum]